MDELWYIYICIYMEQKSQCKKVKIKKSQNGKENKQKNARRNK